MSDDKLTRVPDVTPGALLQLAIEKGLGVEGLERLVALHERVADRAAAIEFAEAMSGFQQACPPIAKSSIAHVTSRSGGEFSYRYAELDEIANTIRPHLHAFGLSYTWDSEFPEDGKRIRCTCTVRHVNGHTVAATFEAPTETTSPFANAQQKAASALTYARRQSLIQVLGLTTADPDDDGRGGPPETISPEQVDVLEFLLDHDANKGRKPKLFAWLKINSLDEVPLAQFERIRSDLQRKVDAST